MVVRPEDRFKPGGPRGSHGGAEDEGAGEVVPPAVRAHTSNRWAG
jgi:hypothetical protein